MKKMLFLSALLACGPACFSQQAEKFPLGDYVELTDTKPHDGEEVWSKMTAPVRFCWGTTDVRYKKLNVPDVKTTGTLRLKAWKGERVNAQAVLWTQKELEGAEIAVSELKNGSSVIPASAVNTYFVRYVMTDELNKDGSGGCGPRENKAEWDSSMVYAESLSKDAYRIELVFDGGNFNISVGTESTAMFAWTPRYRMHYCAVKALLARIYFYMGRTQEAYELAKFVCDMTDGYSKAFEFDSWLDGPKFHGDVIFALYNENNEENYAPYANVSNPLVLRNLLTLFPGDAGMDARFTDQTRELGDGSGFISAKNIATDWGGDNSLIAMIPMIRLSELYYIMCEYLCEGNTVPSEATTLLRDLKRARMDYTSITSITNSSQFLNMVREDARREFIGEGQSFFYYKALNIPVFDGANDVNLGSEYYLPIPDSEHVVL